MSKLPVTPREPSDNHFDFAGQTLDLSKPHVMGILNITPDSFSDGGELIEPGSRRASMRKVLVRAEAMLEAGAVILDVGGESTRPGAQQVSSQEEIDRVIPVVIALKQNTNAIISVDTSNPELIKRCAEVGVGLINDVRALTVKGALNAVAESNLPVCLMHMQGQPDSMQDKPRYNSVIEEVMVFLQERVASCESVGITREKILLDPGFGFGKNLAHNLELLSSIHYLQELKLPVLVGLSRKRMIGAITGKSEKDRMAGSVAAAVLTVMQGARIVRTHDVPETVDALKICAEVLALEGFAKL